MRRLAFSILCLFGCLPVLADPAFPPGGTPLNDGSPLKSWVDPAVGISSPVEEGVQQLKITKADEAKPFLAQISSSIPLSDLAPGDFVLAIIKARSTAGAPGKIEAKIQLAEAPYTSAADSIAFEPGTAWQEYPITFRITQPVGKGGASLALLCAAKTQAIEIASVRTQKYPAGTDTSEFPRIRRTYAGREPDASWRKVALDRIEKQRKADLSLTILASDGKPLANTKIHLKLRRHEFGFGSAVTAELLTADTEDGRRYREIVDRYFSRVVFENDLKDFGWEANASGKAEHLKRLDQAMTWLEQRHISIRGHYLMQVATPSNLAQVTDPDAIRKHFIDTATERLAFANKRVCEWDVINHPVAWSGADLLSQRPGLAKLDREIYHLAEKHSDLPFYVNEDKIFGPGHEPEGTFAYIQQLKQDGFRVDGLGNQAHVDDSYLPSPEQVFAVTERFATLVPHQVITEFDIVTMNDDELAADYTRDLLIACFSHPAYTGFLWWGFWEGRHWKPGAASYRKDWTATTRGKVIEQWLGHEWTTNLTLVTDDVGKVSWRGFPGVYEFVKLDSGSTVSFSVTKLNPTLELKIGNGDMVE
ncbi:endo-1,4-beta-xylanase [Luteolibacter luteus]|uniref:endo-1,4-beta-xylanase n=1 Tax=Luteolibacter luteus TaxID=2728835 RepID=A0A858RQR4_9BACT|nr:endo-1,4-beta-xylanase [Luteolibacter luteus]QJE98874.1 endo-1,4-beta-xylanase [Luteolibacter luteus]